jgi:hypothetical protein
MAYPYRAEEHRRNRIERSLALRNLRQLSCTGDHDDLVCRAAQAASRRIGTNEEAHRIPLRRLGQVEDCAGVLEFLAPISRNTSGVLTPN